MKRSFKTCPVLFLTIAVIILSAFILTGCSNPGVSDAGTADGIIPPYRSASSSGLLIPALAGTVGPGADYAIYMPPPPVEWNGELVLYVHGYIFPPEQFPDGFPDFLARDPIVADSVLASLIGDGFAVAYSSFSETGYAVKDGAIRTRQLRGIFIDNFGKPASTYLLGSSLGGAVSLMLTEKNPELFSGSLLLSAFAGGGQIEVDYIINSYLMFNLYFPEVLPYIMEIPETYTNDQLFQLIGGISGALYFDMIYQGGLNITKMLSVLADGVPVFQSMPGASADEMINTILGPVLFTLFGINDFLDRTNGRLPFDNSETVYAGFTGTGYEELELPDYMRFESSKPATNYLRRWYEPKGRLTIPVLTLHNEYDPVVPFFHEQIFYQKTLESGSQDMLEQWTGNEPFGHGIYHPLEIRAAFDYLRAWTMTGIKPPLP